MSRVHLISKSYQKKDFSCPAYCAGELCTKEHRQSCPLSFWALCRLPILDFFPTHPWNKHSCSWARWCARVQVAEIRASGEEETPALKSVRDHRWTCRILSQGRRRRGHVERSVWKLELHDNNSAEITVLQKLQIWIQGDHITVCLLLLASNCLETDVLHLRNYLFFYFPGEGIILTLKFIDW